MPALPPKPFSQRCTKCTGWIRYEMPEVRKLVRETFRLNVRAARGCCREAYSRPAVVAASAAGHAKECAGCVRRLFKALA
jgi:hypothetical protein